jgi:hypothetical protein
MRTMEANTKPWFEGCETAIERSDEDEVFVANLRLFPLSGRVRMPSRKRRGANVALRGVIAKDDDKECEI